MAQTTTTARMASRFTPPLQASTPPRMAAVSPGKTKPSITAASAKTRRPTRVYAGHPCSESSGWRRRLITPRDPLVHGAQRVLARGELTPAVVHLRHEGLALDEMREDVRLPLGPGQHP